MAFRVRVNSWRFTDPAAPHNVSPDFETNALATQMRNFILTLDPTANVTIQTV